MEYRNIEFPPINAEQEAKFKRLFATMSELMETDGAIETETVMIMRVKIPLVEKALGTVIMRLAQAQKDKNKPTPKPAAK